MYGGMRGIKGLVTETSVLDPEEVICLLDLENVVWFDQNRCTTQFTFVFPGKLVT